MSRKLRAIMVEMTNTCNARCPLCPTGAEKLDRDKGFISVELFKKIVTEVNGFETPFQFISYNYGEPFLHPKWFELYSELDEKIYHRTSTNGYVFYKKENIDKLAHSRLSECIVSIDGSTNELNSKYRKNVDFDKVYEGLQYFFNEYGNKQNRPKILIQTVLLPFNKDDLQNIKLKFEGCFDKIYYKHANFNMTEFKENEDINRNTEQKITDLIPNSCSIFASSLVINWNGVCNPCCHDYNGSVVLGDANRQSIKEIFNSSESNNFYDQIISDRSKNKICSTCPIDRRTTNKRNINYY